MIQRIGTGIIGFAESFLIPFLIYKHIIRRDMVSFYYHLVSGHPAIYIKHIYPCKSHRIFERDLVFIKSAYRFADHNAIYERQTRGKPWPENAVVMTFDDAYSECFTVIRPLLLKHGIHSVLFVAESLTRNKRICFENKISLCVENMLFLAPDMQINILLFIERSINYICLILDVDIEGYMADEFKLSSRQDELSPNTGNDDA